MEEGLGNQVGAAAEWGKIALDYAIQYGPTLVGAVVFIFIAWIIAGWAGSIVRSGMGRAGFDETLSGFAGKGAKFFVLLVAFMGCLSLFGIEMTSLAAVLGATVAIGLAFQGTLSNFAAGVMLLFFRPFQVGDYIKVADEDGFVSELGVFTTLMNTLDHRRVIIPNSNVFGNKIQNFTANDKRRVDIDVGADYSADIDQTRKVLEGAIDKIPGVLKDPGNMVFLSGLGASSVDWQLRVWCKTSDYWDVWQAATREVKVSLDAANIGIPFPQMDVHQK